MLDGSVLSCAAPLCTPGWRRPATPTSSLSRLPQPPRPRSAGSPAPAPSPFHPQRDRSRAPSAEAQAGARLSCRHLQRKGREKPRWRRRRGWAHSAYRPAQAGVSRALALYSPRSPLATAAASQRTAQHRPQLRIRRVAIVQGDPAMATAARFRICGSMRLQLADALSARASPLLSPGHRTSKHPQTIACGATRVCRGSCVPSFLYETTCKSLLLYWRQHCGTGPCAAPRVPLARACHCWQRPSPAISGAGFPHTTRLGAQTLQVTCHCQAQGNRAILSPGLV